MFSRRTEFELKMTHILLVAYILFGSLQIGLAQVISCAYITCTEDIKFNTSNYRILSDRRGGNFSYYEAKCRGKVIFKVGVVKIKVFNLFTVRHF